MRSLSLIFVFLCLAASPVLAQGSGSGTSFQLAQANGKSLSEAVEQVRRQTNGRIVSAETKVKNGREVHHIKVLTEDGKVKTHKVQGRKRGNG
ncbi:MAG: PepSY domain-containing protein [Woeseiaceae bacterium]